MAGETEGAEVSAAEATPTFEIDLDPSDDGSLASGTTSDPAGTAQSAPAIAPAAPALSPEIREALVTAQRANQRADQLEAHIRSQEQQRAATNNKPPYTMEQLSNGGTVEQLMEYISWQQNQQLGHITSMAAAEARRASSESQARGVFNAKEMGDGNDFDSIMNRYVAPAIQQNPHVRDLILAADPENPALVAYVYGALMHAFETGKRDPVAMMKGFFNSLGARQAGAADVTQKIKAAAESGAEKIAVQRGGISAGGPTKIKTGADIWNLSDKAFAALEQQQYPG